MENKKRGDKKTNKDIEEAKDVEILGNSAYGNKKGQCCGKSLGNWMKIILFYLIFYVCLAGFWIGLLIIFYQTLDSRVPLWQLDDSRISSNPGLGFRPRPPTDEVISSLIWFKPGHPPSIKYWKEKMNNFLEPYLNPNQLGKVCSSDGTLKDDEFCKFELNLPADCNSGSSYGFDRGDPCIAIKINRIYNWVPKSFKEAPKDFPFTIKYDPDMVYISCRGLDEVDRENMGTISFVKGPGIEKYYFPFKNQKGYQSPLVFVKFTGVQRGIAVSIECRGWAQNIIYDKIDVHGAVRFTLLID